MKRFPFRTEFEIILLVLLCSACSKKAVQNTQSISKDSESKKVANWKFNAESLDSTAVNNGGVDPLTWYTIYGLYQLESDDVDIDYNTYNLDEIQFQIDRAKPVLAQMPTILERCNKTIAEDFHAEGWTYEYVLDYLVDLSDPQVDYELINQEDKFEKNCQSALEKISLKRIGIFDHQFDSSCHSAAGLYFVLDYWIEGMDSFDMLVVNLNGDGTIKGISIEG